MLRCNTEFTTWACKRADSFDSVLHGEQIYDALHPLSTKWLHTIDNLLHSTIQSQIADVGVAKWNRTSDLLLAYASSNTRLLLIQLSSSQSSRHQRAQVRCGTVKQAASWQFWEVLLCLMTSGLMLKTMPTSWIGFSDGSSRYGRFVLSQQQPCLHTSYDVPDHTPTTDLQLAEPL